MTRRTIPTAIRGLALLAILAAAVPASAQSDGGTSVPIDQPEAVPLSSAIARAFEAAAVEPQPAPADGTAWAAEHRACDGCPRRRPGRAFLQTTAVNGIYELANLARGQVTARITPKTWWANLQQGWVWDLDEFLVNQVGHPYQGSNYFNTGRANGLSYWESAGITAFGSGTWEYFGETNHASVNDLINTTLGGMALGEMFYRTAWLIRDTRASGRGRFWKEMAATVVDPVTGLNRFMSGDSSRISDKPADVVPSRLGAAASAGALWRGTNTRAVNSTGKPFLELDLVYGDPTAGRSRTPYESFATLFRFGGGASISEAKVRGRLLGQPFKNGRVQLNVVQAYDFNQNSAYEFGAQSVNVNLAYTALLSSRTSLWISGWGGLMPLGAVDSIPLTGIEPEEESPDDGAGQGVSEGPRYYDYGPGTAFGSTAVLARDGRALLLFVYEAHQLYSLDGVRANHFLQQIRLDAHVPLRGPLGLGLSGEYFDRRTYYQDAVTETRKYHFPQFRVYLRWRMS